MTLSREEGQEMTLVRAKMVVRRKLIYECPFMDIYTHYANDFG